MPKFAFIFPGQGSQAIGMMAAHANGHPQVKSRFDVAAQVLGFDLWALVADGPLEELNRTQNTQPALLAASVACWDIWRDSGGSAPTLMAGHSFGEYSALVCAGSLAFEEAVELVAARGRLMQEAVPVGVGAMAAVLGLALESLREACMEAAAGEVVECANLNAPGQIVISGHAGAVARASALASQRGAKKIIPLAVSTPIHCALMQPAAQRFEPLIGAAEVRTPNIPVIHNVDVETHSDPEMIRRALLAQFSRPVRWQETIEKFSSSGITRALECGPGKILGPLVRRCIPTIGVGSLGTPEELTTNLLSLNEAGP
ncbi:MAG: [acyl-carrier-protein] S-malonyltransferase [Gammaproteobacteria bacterium]|nr:[acyl-carrier-protein] S-malonyltransferase [Gammaproteobacteria bacterium]